MRKRIGNRLIVLGLLMLFAAGALVWNNFRESNAAEEESRIAMDVLTSVIPTQAAIELTPEGEPVPTEPIPENEMEYPDYILIPEMDMPVHNINGIDYVGQLEILDLGLQLPVINETTNRNLKKAPCRYAGTAYQDNLVIGAHNYNIHFGGIGNLDHGSIITFTDMDGNVFTYQVVDIEILQPKDVDLLCDGRWPLTLYTCTLGGKTRVTVRCDKVESVGTIS